MLPLLWFVDFLSAKKGIHTDVRMCCPDEAAPNLASLWLIPPRLMAVFRQRLIECIFVFAVTVLYHILRCLSMYLPYFDKVCGIHEIFFENAFRFYIFPPKLT